MSQRDRKQAEPPDPPVGSIGQHVEAVVEPTPQESDSERGSVRNVAPPPPTGPVGFAPGLSVELPGKRAADTRVFHNPDGTYTADIYSQPVHFRSADGSWSPIDPTLVDDGGQGLGNKAGAFTARLARRADQAELVSLSVDGATAAFGLAGAEPVEGVVDGNRVRYPSVQAGVDLELVSMNTGVKEYLILNSPAGPTEFLFPLVLDGLTASEDAAGNVVFRSDDGEEVARIPAGYMEDSSLDAARHIGVVSEAVSYELVEHGTGPALRVSLDRGWLEDPARVYPVRVDPTLVDKSVGGDDTFIGNGNSHGSWPEMWIGSTDGGNVRWRSFAHYDGINDLNGVPRVFDADLFLWNFYSPSCDPRGVSAYRLMQGWDGYSLTGYPDTSVDRDPALQGWNAFALGGGPSCPANWGQIDVTNLVRWWVANPTWMNLGLTLEVDGVSWVDTYAYKRFATAETTPSIIRVNYSPYDASYAPASAWNVEPWANRGGSINVTVTNRGTTTWPAGGSVRLTYHLLDANGNVLHDGPRTFMPFDVRPGQSVTLNAAVEALAPGTYYLQWDLVDEYVAWFSKEGVQPGLSLVQVFNQRPVVTAMTPNYGSQQNTVTPTLAVSGYDPDGWPAEGLDYRFVVCPTPVEDASCVDSGWILPNAWTVPTNRLHWRRTYYWRGFVGDKRLAGGSGWNLFTTSVPQPVVARHFGDDPYGSRYLGVNPVVGNYVTSFSDVEVASAGPRLRLLRTYNSADARVGAFGRGFRTGYEMTAVPEAGATVLVTYADGRQERYGRNPDGSFAPASGYFSSLGANPATGGHVLRDRSGVAYQFDASGRLTSTTDPAGRRLDLSYVGQNLARVQDPASGRGLNFTWSGAFVTRVATDRLGGWLGALEWTYGYTGDLLTSVCSPMPGSCSTYGYTTASPTGLLASVTLPKQNTPVRLGYRGDGTVAWREDAKGKRWTFDSSLAPAVQLDGPAAYWRLGETSGSTAADASGHGLTANYRNSVGLGQPGAVGWDPNASVALAGSAAHVELPAGFDDFTGGLTMEAWVHPASVGSWQRIFDLGRGPAADNVILARAGTTNDLVFGVWRGSAVQSLTVPNVIESNTWQHLAVTLSAGGTATIYKNGQAVGSGPVWVPNNVQRTANFLGRSNWSADAYFTGRIDEAAVFRTALAPERIQAHADGRTVTVTNPRSKTTRYAYINGRLRSHQDEEGWTRTFAYSDLGFLRQITDENGNVLTVESDARGNILARTTTRAGVANTTWYEYCVPTSGPCGGYSAQDPRLDKVLSVRDARGGGFEDTYRTRYAYTATGALASVTTPPTPDFPAGRTTAYAYTTSSTGAFGGGSTPPGLLASVTNARQHVTRYEYDAKGDLRGVTDPVGLRLELSYDALGRQTTVKEFSDSFPSGLTTSRIYTFLGQVSTVTAPAITNAVTGATHTARTTHTYDANGNVSKVELVDTSGGDPPRTTAYTHDGNDRLDSLTDAEGGRTAFGYDDVGNLSTVTDPLGGVTEYRYTDRGQLQATVAKGFVDDPVNPGAARDVLVEQRAYDPGGRLAEVTDGRGLRTRYQYFADDLVDRIIRVGYRNPYGVSPPVRDIVVEAKEYDAAGNVTKLTTGGGRTRVDLTVDAAGRLSRSVLDPAGLNRHQIYGYDAADNLTSMATSVGGTGRIESVTFTHDAVGRVLTEAVANDATPNIVRVISRDQRGHPRTVTSPRGYVADLAYDEAGRLRATTAPAVAAEENGAAPVTVRPSEAVGYNTAGQPTHHRDARGGVTVSGFDRLGRRTTTAHPAYTTPAGVAVAAQESATYDANGNVVTRTDRRGHTTSFTYDKRNRLVRVQEPAVDAGVPIWRYSYDDNSNLLSRTDPAGAVRRTSYDDLNRPRIQTVVERVPALANLPTQLDYDDSGNLTSVIATDWAWTRATYNAANERTTLTDPAGNVTRFDYDVAGRPARETDPLGRATEWRYDLAGRPTERRRLDAAATLLERVGFAHDLAGNPTSVTRPSGFARTMTYDALDRLSSLVEPLSATKAVTVSFGYDAAGNRTRITDGRGNPTISAYNPWDLVEKVIEPTTSAHPALVDRTWTTTYDAGALPVTLAAPGGVVRTRSFDAGGRLRTETATGSPTETRSMAYDLADRVISAAAPGGTQTFSYNDRGAVVTSAGPMGPAALAYDSGLRLTSKTDASGTTTFTYDSRSLLSTATDPHTGATRTYTYDAAAQLRGVSFGAGKAGRTRDYDGLGRLTSDVTVSGSGSVIYSLAYAYDANSNVASKTVGPAAAAGGGTHAYTYDGADRLMSWTPPGAPATAYTWDDAGNRTAAGTTSFAYDERNRLLRQDAPSGSTTQLYTPRGTLASTTLNGATTALAFDGFDRLTAEGGTTYQYDSLDRLARRNTTGLSYAGLGREVVADGAFTYARGPQEEPLALAKGAAKLAVVQDGHADVVATFSPTGAAAADTVHLSPWGERKGANGATGVSLGFQGDWTDPTTARTWMDARWYVSASGGFLSRDDWDLEPLLGGAHLNRYLYGAANPLGFTDPTGHSPESEVCLFDPVSYCQVQGAFEHDTGNILTGYDETGAPITSLLDKLDAIGDILLPLGEAPITPAETPIPPGGGSKGGERKHRARPRPQPKVTATGPTGAISIVPGPGQPLPSWSSMFGLEPPPVTDMGTAEIPQFNPEGAIGVAPTITVEDIFDPRVEGIDVSDPTLDVGPLPGFAAPEQSMCGLITAGAMSGCVPELPADDWMGAFGGVDLEMPGINLGGALPGFTLGFGPLPLHLAAETEGGVASAVARGGESEAAATGRAVHGDFDQQLRNLNELDPRFAPGLRSGPNRPDGFFDGDPIELKPDTPSGLRSGRTQLSRYMDAFGADRGYLVVYDENGAFRIAQVMGL